MQKYLHLRPFPLLKRISPQINKGAVLDIGAGNGRNVLYLAKNGFKIMAIDNHLQSIKQLKNLPSRLKSNFNIKKIDVRKFNFSTNKYDLILAIQSLIWMKKSDFSKIIKNIKKSLKIDGVAIISGFTIQDPSCLNLKSLRTPVEKNTFYSQSEKRFWQFLEHQELKKYFQKDFKILYYKEKLTKDKSHDKISYPHYHAIAEIAVKKMRDI